MAFLKGPGVLQIGHSYFLRVLEHSKQMHTYRKIINLFKLTMTAFFKKYI